MKKKPSNKNQIKELEKATLHLHGCKSKWVESVPVKEIFEGEIVWEGIVVEFFDLLDHPTAKRCYAWSHLMDDSNKRRIIEVLHQGPVD